MGEARPDGPHELGAQHDSLASPYGDLMAALRTVLPAQLRPDMPEAEVGRALQPVLRLARARGVPASQVLIAAKHTWASLPEVRSLDDPDRLARRLERLVTICVERYYAD